MKNDDIGRIYHVDCKRKVDKVHCNKIISTVGGIKRLDARMVQT